MDLRRIFIIKWQPNCGLRKILLQNGIKLEYSFVDSVKESSSLKRYRPLAGLKRISKKWDVRIKDKKG